MRQHTLPLLDQRMACRLFGTKPLSEPILTGCQLDSHEQIPAQYIDGNWKIFIQENAFENVHFKMATVMSRSQRVDSERQRNLGNGGNRFSNFHPPPVDPPHIGPVIMITSWHEKVLRIMYPLWGQSWWPHDMTHFLHCWPFVRRIHWSSMAHTKGSELRLFLYLTEQAIELTSLWYPSQSPVTLVLSLLSAWTSCRAICLWRCGNPSQENWSSCTHVNRKYNRQRLSAAKRNPITYNIGLTYNKLTTVKSLI